MGREVCRDQNHAPHILTYSVHVQVGMSTGLTARVAWKYDKRTTLHSSARVSVVGGPSQVELGARYRWGRLTSTGLAVAYGTQVQPLCCSPLHCPSPCPVPSAGPSALPSALTCDLCRAFGPCPALPCPCLLCHTWVRSLPALCPSICPALCLAMHLPCPALSCPAITIYITTYSQVQSCALVRHLPCSLPCLAVLCRAVLCCAVLCCAVLCCAVLCRAVLYHAASAVLCHTVLCCAVLCCAVPCCAVLCCAVLCCAVLCCAELFHSLLCCAVLCYAGLVTDSPWLCGRGCS